LPTSQTMTGNCIKHIPDRDILSLYNIGFSQNTRSGGQTKHPHLVDYSSLSSSGMTINSTAAILSYG